MLFYVFACPSQVRAIVSATLDLALEGVEIQPRILVPMLCTAHELEAALGLIDRTAYQVGNSVCCTMCLNCH